MKYIRIILLSLAVYALFLSHQLNEESRKLNAESQSIVAQMETRVNQERYKLILLEKTNKDLQERGVYRLNK